MEVTREGYPDPPEVGDGAEIVGSVFFEDGKVVAREGDTGQMDNEELEAVIAQMNQAAGLLGENDSCVIVRADGTTEMVSDEEGE